MAIEAANYVSYAEAVYLHICLMKLLGETRYGVFDRALLQSALARPQQSGVYEQANLIRQAATLCFGLIKNHPFIGGNKRTATALVDEFLFRNHIEVTAATAEIIELVLAIEAGTWAIDEAEAWLRAHTRAHSFRVPDA
ncbi:MAG: death on curing protein [Acidobacteriota bacterium]|nr:death on curing protein [Acidobacteriota bacterium]